MSEQQQPPALFPSAEELNRRRTDRRQATAGRAPGGFERRLYLRRSADDALPFVAPSLARRTPDNENTAPDTVAVRVSFDAPAPVAEPRSVSPAAAVVPAADPRQAAVGELGLVQLVERLGASLEKRRRQAVAGPAPAATVVASSATGVVEPVSEDFDVAIEGVEAAPAEEAARAMAAYFASTAPHAAPQPPVEPAADCFASDASNPDEGPAEEPADDADYGSLLSLRTSLAQPNAEFVRVEQPAPPPEAAQPAAVFPSAQVRPFDRPAADRTVETPPQVPAETDEALRRALATLQRMTRGG